VVLNGSLAPTGHDDDVLYAGMNRLLDAVLDDGFVDDGQHLFGLRLGRWQKTRPESRGGENSFANFSRHRLPVSCSGAAIGN